MQAREGRKTSRKDEERAADDRDRVTMGTYVDRRVIRESLEADISDEVSS